MVVGELLHLARHAREREQLCAMDPHAERGRGADGVGQHDRSRRELGLPAVAVRDRTVARAQVVEDCLPRRGVEPQRAARELRRDVASAVVERWPEAAGRDNDVDAAARFVHRALQQQRIVADDGEALDCEAVPFEQLREPARVRVEVGTVDQLVADRKDLCGADRATHAVSPAGGTNDASCRLPRAVITRPTR